MHRLFIGIVFLLIATPLFATIKGDVVIYKQGNTILKGYIAYDDAVKGKRPGIVLVPDWWGVGQFVRDRARALAKLGYTAMVMDIYGNGKYVEPPKEAGKLMDQFTADPNTMNVRFDATYQALIKHKTVDREHVAAVGYSLGGLVVLEMARRGRKLDGVASIWGVITKTNNPAEKGKITAKVLVQQPAKDGWAPMEEVNKLKKEMADAGVDARVIVYPGTVHGFSRHDATIRAEKYKSLPIRYNAEAEKQSWADLSDFLQASFK